MLRYVIHHHTGGGDAHFDLMFETTPGSALATWRSAEWPVTAASTVTPIADHRLAYLDYEGPVSGNRGSVRRVAQGSHRVLRNDSVMLILELDDGTVLTLHRAS